MFELAKHKFIQLQKDVFNQNKKYTILLVADVAIQIKQMFICFGSIDYFSPTI